MILCVRQLQVSSSSLHGRRLLLGRQRACDTLLGMQALDAGGNLAVVICVGAYASDLFLVRDVRVHVRGLL